MAGVTIRHETDRNCVRVTPLMWQPMITNPGHIPHVCNVCQIHHPFKVIHFWLGPNGEAVVATGIWETMQRIGNGDGLPPRDGFTVVSEVKKPPPLRLGRQADRAQVDDKNRAQVVYNAKQLTKGTISNG